MLISIWNEGLKVELKPISKFSLAKSSTNTSLDISTMPDEQSPESPGPDQIQEPEAIISGPESTPEQIVRIENGLPKESTLHKDNIPRGIPKQNKASLNQLISMRPSKKAKYDTAILLLDYLIEVTSMTFTSLPSTTSAFIDEDKMKVQRFSNIVCYLHLHDFKFILIDLFRSFELLQDFYTNFSTIEVYNY